MMLSIPALIGRCGRNPLSPREEVSGEKYLEASSGELAMAVGKETNSWQKDECESSDDYKRR